jgi:flavin-dependent dehydrogenase
MADNHYDVIIIGSGAGGGTLAYRLAPTGKKIRHKTPIGAWDGGFARGLDPRARGLR